MLDIFLILGLILAVGAFIAWPEISLYAIALSLPTIGWLLYFLNFVFTGVDLVALLALAAFTLRAAYQFFFRPAKKSKLKWPLLLPFSLFLVANLISSLLARDPLYSLYYIVRWPLFLYFAYIFLPYNLITSGKILRRTISLIIISSTVVLISGYLSLFAQDWRDSFFRLKSILLFDIYPFGENHNLVAEFLNVGAFLILAAKEWVKDQTKKKILVVAFILTVTGIILTFSRAGWITLGLQLVIYAGYQLRFKDKTDKVNYLFAVVGLLVILSPILVKMSILQEKNTSSTENRWLMTEIAIQAFLSKPYFGTGSGEFINLVDENIRFKANYGPAIDSHGVLQKVAAENGAFGLATWLFILAYLFKVAFGALRKYHRENPWILPLILASAGGLFFQFFNTSYYKGKVWVPVAISLAAIRLLENKYARKN